MVKLRDAKYLFILLLISCQQNPRGQDSLGAINLPEWKSKEHELKVRQILNPVYSGQMVISEYFFLDDKVHHEVDIQLDVLDLESDSLLGLIAPVFDSVYICRDYTLVFRYQHQNGKYIEFISTSTFPENCQEYLEYSYTLHRHAYEAMDSIVFEAKKRNFQEDNP